MNLDKLDQNGTKGLTEQGEYSKVFVPDYSEATVDILPGTYNVLVISCNEMVSKNGSPMIAWDLRIIDSDEFESAPLRYFTVMSGRGADRLRDFLKAINPLYDGTAFCPDHFLNRKITVSIIQGNSIDGAKTVYPRIASVLQYTGH
jgi:hypothetical protein